MDTRLKNYLKYRKSRRTEKEKVAESAVTLADITAD